MNKLMRLFAIFLLTFGASPSRAERIEIDAVPKAVLDSFYKAHPKQKNIRVDRERHFDTVLYEIKFGDSDSHAHQTLFTADGIQFGHEKPIPNRLLPDKVKNSINRLFKSVTIKDAEEIHQPGTHRVEYEVDVIGDGGDWEIGLDSDGTVIRKETN